ncbi:DsbA family protein [Nitrospira moscoviensis]|uniref:DSBA oxidoreductase n=1 Tax=Nitrospira moscoviensis TaxID=42253 RepID=A0A0K2GE40_NITMO|nr:thioredoxin domain-containing protein [Nitrospira moscoviensis]ALA59221.1 DSBA oxidoreductase [Nitrospira moscoviensis]
MSVSNRVDSRLLAIQPDDHVAGAGTAPITVVGYCDFECPYCARAQQVMSRLLVRHEGRVRYVFRHFPLVHKHPLAEQAAEFAEAAAAQGRFWPIHDFLFTYQETLDLGDLFTYAGKLGLDVKRIEEEMARRAYAARVQRDLDGGRRLGVTGTPTFFLNDMRYQDEDEVARAVRRAA